MSIQMEIAISFKLKIGSYEGKVAKIKTTISALLFKMEKLLASSHLVPLLCDFESWCDSFSK